MRYVTEDERIGRYLAIVEWARRRYTRDGVLVIAVGDVLSQYSRIERMAFARYFDEDEPFDTDGPQPADGFESERRNDAWASARLSRLIAEP